MLVVLLMTDEDLDCHCRQFDTAVTLTQTVVNRVRECMFVNIKNFYLQEDK
jgi:hypothetical protein